MGEVVDLRHPRVGREAADTSAGVTNDDPRPGNGAREALKVALPGVAYGPIDELLATLWWLGFKIVPLTSDDERDGA